MSGFNPSYLDDEEDDLHIEYNGREAIIFLIDCNQTMFDGSAAGNFGKCINCIEAVMLNKIICSERDLLSIVLYNTQHSPLPKLDKDDVEEMMITVPSSCAIMTALKPVSVESVRFIKNLKESEDLLDFDNFYGHSTDAKMSDVLWFCSSMFAKCGYKLSISSIQMFTNIDIPHPIGSPDFQTAILKAKDLQQLNFDFRLFPMKESFSDAFYRELICTIQNLSLDEFEMPKYEEEEELMMRRLFKKNYKKRAQTHLHFKLNDEVYFAVDLFGFVRKTLVPKPVFRGRENNEPVGSKRSYKYAEIPEEETSVPLDFTEELTPNITVKYQQIGGEKICFTPLEVYEMKQVLDPGIKLLGFKPITAINPDMHLKNTYFLYPSDTRIKNSSVLFRALWEKCLEKEKVAICIATLRKKSHPKLVALIPQKEEESKNGDILRFDGFRMVQIPFAGDVRNLKMLNEEAPEINEEACEIMKKIVRKLTLRDGYQPYLFENPVIRTVFANIESVCYDKEVEEIEDTVMPNIACQDRKIKDLVDQLQNIFGEFYIDKEAAKRRAKEDRDAAKASKIAKIDVDSESILDAIREGNTKSITVAALKNYAQTIGLAGLSKLVKGTLIEKIKEYHGI